MFNINKNILYIFTSLEAIEKIFIYTEDLNSANALFIKNNQMNLNAVLNLLIAIGEDSSKIEDELKYKFNKIDWKAIKGLRNELSHNYRGVDIDIIWDIVENFLPDLKQSLIEIFIHIFSISDFDKKGILDLLDNDYYRNINYLKSMIID